MITLKSLHNTKIFPKKWSCQVSCDDLSQLTPLADPVATSLNTDGLGVHSGNGAEDRYSEAIHSSVVVTRAWRGKTFSVSTRCTSGSRSAQASASTVR